MTVTAIKATGTNNNVDGSGTTAMASGAFSPEMSDAFTVAPERVYSPTVSLPTFVTRICVRAYGAC